MESVLRKWLNDIYVGIVHSTENCEFLVSQKPENYDYSMIKGNELTRECMINACYWLQGIRRFVRDSETFEAQFLKPAQISAEYILKIRNNAPTTSIQGWVFSKSEPYDDSRFGIERVTISMVVPSLKTIMSLRLRTEESQRIDYGFYEFAEVQPVPLVNRLHQFHPKIAPLDKKFFLKSCDYLKVYFDDFEKFSDSIEMSNFCEINSVQSGLRHHLGSAFVVPCKILKTRQPRITIQSTVSDSTKTLLMSDQLLKNLDCDFLDSLKKKTARLLAVQWYDPGDSDELSKKTEVLAIELEENLSDLQNDELIGFVRLRNEVSTKKLKEVFGDVSLNSSASLILEKENVKFSTSVDSQNFVIDEFLKSVEHLRQLGSSARKDEHIQLNCFDVIDKEKLSAAGLAKLVKNNNIVSGILNNILKTMDTKGELSRVSNISKVLGINEDSIRRNVSLLRHLEIVENVDGMLQITSKGKKVMLVALKNKINDEILNSSQDIISIPDFKTDFSPSLLCDFLKKPESEYFPVILKSGKNKLFWTKTQDENIRKMFQERFDFMKSQIILATRSLNYPFTTSKAMEENLKINDQIDFFSTKFLINELVKENVLIPSGKSWRLPLENRVRSLLGENPDYVYSLDEIISLLSIPLMSKEETLNILNKLDSEGIISLIPPRGWSSKGSEIEKSEKRLMNIMMKRALGLLKSRQHGLDEQVLMGMMERVAYDLCKGTKFMSRKNLAKEFLSKLKKDANILFNDGIYKIKND